jgi:hypothetical protein
VELADCIVVHPLDQRVDLCRQGRHAVGGGATGGQRANDGDANQRDFLGQVVGRGRETWARLPKSGLKSWVS